MLQSHAMAHRSGCDFTALDPNRKKKKVFFISSHGMAGDHLFDWLPKAINSHPEILLFLGESVRSKYFKERSRKERPKVSEYV